MELILDQTATLLKVIEKLENDIDVLNQVIEDNFPYAASEYWEWLLGEGKKKQEALIAIAEKALETFANIENWNDHDYGSRIPEWQHNSKPWQIAKEALEEIKKEKSQ